MQMKMIFNTLFVFLTAFGYTQNSQNEFNTRRANSLLIEDFRNRNTNKNFETFNSSAEIKSSINEALKAKPISMTAHLDSVYVLDWDVHLTEWKLMKRFTDIEYSSAQQLTVYTVQKLSNNSWLNETKHHFSFDQAGNRTSYILLHWEDNKWENFSKITTTYNSQNDPVNILEQTWNDNVWENGSSTEYSYDASKNLISELLKNWSGTDWVNSTKAIYTYNLSNILTGITIQSYSSSWLNVIKGEFTYNTDNTLSNEFDYVWDGINWINYAWFNYKYNENKKVIKELIKVWASTIWDNYERSNYNYDANNNMVFMLSERSFEADWISYYQYECDYDANNILTYESDKYWDVTGTEIINGEKNVYYFHSVPSGRTDSGINEISLFPNPSNGKFAIYNLPSSSIIEVYTTNGEKIYSKSNSKKQVNMEINLSGFSSGIYLLKVISGREIHRKSLIIQ